METARGLALAGAAVLGELGEGCDVQDDGDAEEESAEEVEGTGREAPGQVQGAGTEGEGEGKQSNGEKDAGFAVGAEGRMHGEGIVRGFPGERNLITQP